MADETREKFRPTIDEKLANEIDAALEGVSLDDLYSEARAAKPASAVSAPKGPRKGRVIAVDEKREEIIVDFGSKTQGVCSTLQFEQVPKVGDEMEFNVDRYNVAEGLLILSKIGSISTNISWENIEPGTIVEGIVTGMNKGGLEVQVKNMRAFMPSGQVDIYFCKDLSVYLNQKITAEVTQCDPHAKNLIISRRNVLEREKEQQKATLLAEIGEGQIRMGTVRTVMDYGAFVDLGGLDGLVHISEMTHRRGHKPSEFVKEGDIVQVKIIRIDKDTGKLSLSLKQTLADPWIGAENTYAVGALVTGRVSKIADFGAFVEAEEGIEGLLPISEMSWQRIKHPSDVVKEGETLRLVILSIDVANHKISFSLKQAGPNPWSTVNERYATDMLVSGTVTRTADFGAFVELEPGLEGLVHISELAGNRVKNVTDVVKVGQSVQARVLEIDKEARRISLSIKRALETAVPETSSTPTPTTPPKKRKEPLQGGLDFGYWNQKKL
jgi:small subunit ribosomal protein S1